jgi:flagellar basal body-associated protein FliL
MGEKERGANSQKNTKSGRPLSPVLILAVSALAIVVVVVLAVVVLSNKGGPGDSSPGTTVGPADAKVKVVVFSDFQ